MTFSKQLEKMRTQDGFIAALDQSGGSTPKALKAYGINESDYNNDEQMYDLVHAMRSRIITSPVFTSDRIIGAILFENTLDREIEGEPTSQYLWEEKGVVPSITQLSSALEGKMNIEDIHNFGPDYDQTLMAWCENFERNWHKISDQYNDRFYRMWRYYLLSCAGAFRSRDLNLLQFSLTKKVVNYHYMFVLRKQLPIIFSLKLSVLFN